MIRQFFMFIIPGLLDRIAGLLPRNVLFCLAISVLVSTSAWGGQTGKVTGRITDAETGEPLPGANVLLEETSMGASTDLEGYYVILNISPGTYDLKVSMMGYTQQGVEGLKVSLDRKSTRLNSSHKPISYAVFCLKKKNKQTSMLKTRF